jgi:hypothetical protein
VFVISLLSGFEVLLDTICGNMRINPLANLGTHRSKSVHEPMKTTVNSKQVNWKYLPDPIRESEVNIQLNWTADERTRLCIERQAACMGFESPTAYLHQALAATLAGNEEYTVITNDGRIVCGSDAYDRNGMPRNV